LSRTLRLVAAKNYFRPLEPEAADPSDLERFAELSFVTVDRDFGGWAVAQAEHLTDGGVFDQIYATR